MLAFQTENGKRKTRRFSAICLQFAHRANGNCVFKPTKRTKGTKRTCPSMYTIHIFGNPRNFLGDNVLMYSKFGRSISVSHATLKVTL